MEKKEPLKCVAYQLQANRKFGHAPAAIAILSKTYFSSIAAFECTIRSIILHSDWHQSRSIKARGKSLKTQFRKKITPNVKHGKIVSESGEFNVSNRRLDVLELR